MTEDDTTTRSARRRGSTGDDDRAAAERLENISVVLVEPQSPGNVGSVARAMMNNSISSLVLVNPCDYVNNEAFSMACNAQRVLREAVVHPTLDSYLAAPAGQGPAGLATVGITRRRGKLRTPVLTIDEGAEKILSLARASRVALLFGREDRGLENTELPLCDILVDIPSSAGYPSLNLSHAVTIVCHYLFRAASPPAGPSFELAPRAEIELMHEHIERTLRALDYGNKGGEHLLKTILRNFQRLFGRAGLMDKEVAMIRGILAQIEERVGRG